MNDLIHGKEMDDGYIGFPSEINELSRLCKISKAALRKLQREPEKELVFEEIFEIHKHTILDIARQMIKSGNTNPIIEPINI